MSKKKTFEEFIAQAIDKHGNKYDYDKSTYINTHTKMLIKCPIHGWFEQTPKAHLRYGCNKCAIEYRANKNMFTKEKFIEKAKKIHGNKYNYSKVEYHGIRAKILIGCKTHGFFYQTPMGHLNGNGCSLCNESHLEREVRNKFNEIGINFEAQKKFKWLKRKSLDFYLPEKNIAIECQGKQHLGYGGWDMDFNFNELFLRDKDKKLSCEENNVKLYYLIDKNYKEASKKIEIYTEENTFTNINDLINKIYEEN